MEDRLGVLVVDDSAFMRKVITEIINTSDTFYVVSTARNGLDALEKLEQYGPEIQLVTLDIQMPKMDGLECLRRIMTEHPRRVVMVSSLTTEGAEETMKALEYGAIDFIAKPGGMAISLDFEQVAPQLLGILTVASRSRLPKPGAPQLSRITHKVAPIESSRALRGHRRLVVVASSTGGPKALASFIPALPRNLHAAMIIIQHMPATFTQFMANRLDQASQIKVKEAREGDQLQEGQCLVAPGGYHLEVTRAEAVRLTKDPPIGGLRPCADLTLKTVAPVFGSRAMAVVLTGMGHDGTEGCRTLKGRGSPVLAESRTSALIWGMPRSVVEKGLADREVVISEMAQAVVDTINTL